MTIHHCLCLGDIPGVESFELVRPIADVSEETLLCR